jgi:hypothetical protein
MQNAEIGGCVQRRFAAFGKFCTLKMRCNPEREDRASGARSGEQSSKAAKQQLPVAAPHSLQYMYHLNAVTHELMNALKPQVPHTAVATAQIPLRSQTRDLAGLDTALGLIQPPFITS